MTLCLTLVGCKKSLQETSWGRIEDNKVIKIVFVGTTCTMFEKIDVNGELKNSEVNTGTYIYDHPNVTINIKGEKLEGGISDDDIMTLGEDLYLKY